MNSKFVCTILVYTLMLIPSINTLKADAPKRAKTETNIMMENETVQKVMNAMLSMQRRAWEQGVAAQALLEMGETDFVVLFAKDAVVNQWKDGRLGLNGHDRPVTDPASNGEPLLFAANITADRELKKAADRMLNFLLNIAPRTSEGIIYHNYIENMIWVDAFYMAPPFLAVAGYPEEAVKQCVGYRRILLDSEKKLYYHMWDEDLQEYSRKVFWGTGNGWAAAGMARVIKALPETMQDDKEMLAGFVKEIVDGILPYMREDGRFQDILDDPSAFIDTNTSQMFAYTIYRGVAGNWLDAAYLKQADKMRAAAWKQVDKFGIVQEVCGAPNFNRSGTSCEAQAFFLLMEAAYYDLNTKK